MLLRRAAAATTRARSRARDRVRPRPAWSPDGRRIYFVAADAPTADERERERRKDDVYALDENCQARQLWSVAVATGRGTAASRPGHSRSCRTDRLARRLAHRRRTRARRRSRTIEHRAELWVMDADGGNARAAHAQRHRGSPARALARQQPDPVPRRNQREARAVLQLERLRDAGGGRDAELLAARFSIRDRPGRVVARRRVDPRRRQHGRAQRDRSRSTSRHGSGRR